MPQPDMTPTGHSPREEVFRELAQFLHQRNIPTPKSKYATLDRPFVLTLISGVLVTLLTLMIQNHQKQTELQLQNQHSLLEQEFTLLRTLPSMYQRQSNILNGMLEQVIWLTEEHLKPEENRKKAEIEKWEKELKRLYDVYTQLEPIDGLLVQIESLFKSESVQTQAKDLRTRLREFELLASTAIGSRNDNGHMPESEVESVKKQANKLVKAMDSLETALLQSMGAELSR